MRDDRGVEALDVPAKKARSLLPERLLILALVLLVAYLLA